MAVAAARFDPPQSAVIINLTDDAIIAIDGSRWNDYAILRVTLGGSRTLGAPTNMRDGQRFLLEVTQDNIGNRTLAYNAIYGFSTDLASPTLTTTAGKTDRMLFEYSLPRVKVDCLSKNFGF